MQNTLTLDRGRLVVEPTGLNKLWGFRRRIVVPLDQVRGATSVPGATNAGKGMRFPGLAIPGRKWVGTFYEDGDDVSWNVRADGRAMADRINDAVSA